MSNLTFAVLVDGENASKNEYVSTLSEVEKYGTVAIKWVYADWTARHQNGWQEILHETASSPKQQFHYGKDAADHALVMDAIELISKNSRINGVCIVSSDGGFYSLAQRIREHGLHVMAIGKKNTPDKFIRACHNFVFIDNLDSPNGILDKTDLDTLLLNSYKRCSDANEPVYMGNLGTMLKSLDSSFDSRTYGHSSLKKLIKSNDHLFRIVEEKSDRCYITLACDSKKIQLTGVVRKWVVDNKFGFIETKDGDYYFKEQDIKNVTNQQIKVKDKVTFLAPITSLADNGTDTDACPKAESVKII
ncbi:NYN domain-containing protein [Colwelliaceae bacterium BS250]